MAWECEECPGVGGDEGWGDGGGGGDGNVCGWVVREHMMARRREGKGEWVMGGDGWDGKIRGVGGWREEGGGEGCVVIGERVTWQQMTQNALTCPLVTQCD